MNRPPRKEVERGLYAPVWRKINAMLDYMAEISVTGGRGIRVDRKVNGTFLTADIPRVEGGTPGVIKQFLVRTVEADYLSCQEYDGTNASGSTIRVAKPFNLRRTAWDGRTRVYTVEPYPGAPSSLTITYSFPDAASHTYRTARYQVGNVSTTEHQVVIPRWIQDVSVIFASISDNGTGVSSANEWQDLNSDGRSWANIL